MGNPEEAGGREGFLFLLALNEMVFQGKAYRSYFNKIPASYTVSLRSLQGGKALKQQRHAREAPLVDSKQHSPQASGPQSAPALHPMPQPLNTAA